MTSIVNLIGEINDFLTTHNSDNETLEFLIGMKRKLLEVDESMLIKKENNVDLPIIEVMLRSVGKRAFVNCYKYFEGVYRGELTDINNEMKRCSGAKTDNSVRTKVSVGIRIFREDLQIDALKNILEAGKVDNETKKKARALLEKRDSI